VGAGVAPWNYSQYLFEQDSKGSFTVDGVPLIFYHFHQLQLLTDGRFDRFSGFYSAIASEPELIYEVYEEELTNVLHMIRSLRPNFSAGIKSLLRIKSQRIVQYLFPHWIKQLLKKFIKAV
jgi:hypothetical protein